MNRTDFEFFISKNKLKKKDIAEYLGVSSAFITALCAGTRPVPSDKIDLIKSNTDWDTSMFADDNEILKNTSSQKAEDVNATENAAMMVTIPQSVWAVIEKQAASLRAKDSQMDRLITQIEQSNARYDRLFASISGVSTGFLGAETNWEGKNPPP